MYKGETAAFHILMEIYIHDNLKVIKLHCYFPQFIALNLSRSIYRAYLDFMSDFFI